MCRILLYVGRYRPEIVRELFDSLIKVAESDVIGVLSGIDENHPDGWGLYYLNLSKKNKLMYKSGNAIFSEHSTCRDILRVIESYSRDDTCVILAHVRAASTGEPLGTEHSHPYTYLTRKGVEVVFAHNGAVYKDKLAEVVRVNPSKFTDSCIAGLYIAFKIEQGEPVPQVLKELMRDYTKTAFMTVSILNEGENVQIYVTSHLVERYSHRASYYRLFRIDVDEQTRVYMSSSLAHHVHVLEEEKIAKRLPATPLPLSFHVEKIELTP